MFMTDTPGLVQKCRVGPGISGHDLVITDMTMKVRINKKPPRKVFLYKKANWQSLEDDITQAETNFFSSTPSERSVEDNWQQFKSALISALDKNVPSKTIRERFDMPWPGHQRSKACPPSARQGLQEKETVQETK